jgi:SAM-dependent methyltransferase
MDVDAADFIIKTQNIKVITTPLEEFPFNGMKFNKIVALEVLEHLTNPSLGLSVLFDLLEPNGVLIVTTPPPYHKNLLDSTHLYVLPAKCWERLFEYAGYLNIRIIPLSLIPFLYRISKYLSLGLRISTGMPGIVSTNLIIAQK